MKLVIIDGATVNGRAMQPVVDVIKELGGELCIRIMAKAPKIANWYESELSAVSDDVLSDSVVATTEDFCDCVKWWLEDITADRPFNASTDIVYLLTLSKAVAATAIASLPDEVKVVMLESVATNYAKRANTQSLHLSVPPSTKTDSVPPIPDWYRFSNIQPEIGLATEVCGFSSLCPRPKFIPFLGNKKVLTIGKKADISLEVWDTQNGLNDEVAEFEYHVLPNSGWTIRALKGLRRGKKAVILNNRLLDASQGAIPLKDGDAIELGIFRFVFFGNRREELLRYESANTIILQTELMLKHFTEQFSVQNVPSEIRDEVSITVYNNGAIRWRHAFLRHYCIFISANWEHRNSSSMRQSFTSVEQFSQSSHKINQIRNWVFHPKRSLSYSDKEILVDFYLKVFDAINQ